MLKNYKSFELLEQYLSYLTVISKRSLIGWVYLSSEVWDNFK